MFKSRRTNSTFKLRSWTTKLNYVVEPQFSSTWTHSSSIFRPSKHQLKTLTSCYFFRKIFFFPPPPKKKKINILLPLVPPNEDYRMLHGYLRQTRPKGDWARLNAQLIHYLYLKKINFAKNIIILYFSLTQEIDHKVFSCWSTLISKYNSVSDR